MISTSILPFGFHRRPSNKTLPINSLTRRVHRNAVLSAIGKITRVLLFFFKTYSTGRAPQRVICERKVQRSRVGSCLFVRNSINFALLRNNTSFRSDNGIELYICVYILILNGIIAYDICTKCIPARTSRPRYEFIFKKILWISTAVWQRRVLLIHRHSAACTRLKTIQSEYSIFTCVFYIVSG